MKSEISTKTHYCLADCDTQFKSSSANLHRNNNNKRNGNRKVNFRWHLIYTLSRSPKKKTKTNKKPQK